MSTKHQLDEPEPGCSDGGCVLRDNSKRMHTNGGCSCLRGLTPIVRVEVRRRLAEWREMSEANS